MFALGFKQGLKFATATLSSLQSTEPVQYHGTNIEALHHSQVVEHVVINLLGGDQCHLPNLGDMLSSGFRGSTKPDTTSEDLPNCDYYSRRLAKSGTSGSALRLNNLAAPGRKILESTTSNLTAASRPNGPLFLSIRNQVHPYTSAAQLHAPRSR